MELNEVQKAFIYEKLEKLKRSKFRSGFYLHAKERNYLESKGFEIVEQHAFEFVRNRLGNMIILNDGKQTPMKGHPVFVAQHATATCCRSCLYKWHKIEKNKKLSDKEIRYIVAVIMEWLKINI